MNPLRVVIDTNVAVSRLLFGGLPLKVVEAPLFDRFLWVSSAQLMTELETVLSSKKFNLSPKKNEKLLKPIYEKVEIVVPSEQINLILRCPGDNRVLECAIEGKCKYIVTGDHRDLISLHPFRGISISTPREFYEKVMA